jgi:hypothetical protein
LRRAGRFAALQQAGALSLRELWAGTLRAARAADKHDWRYQPGLRDLLSAQISGEAAPVEHPAHVSVFLMEQNERGERLSHRNDVIL